MLTDSKRLNPAATLKFVVQETRNYGLAFVKFSCGSAVLHETVSSCTA